MALLQAYYGPWLLLMQPRASLEHVVSSVTVAPAVAAVITGVATLAALSSCPAWRPAADRGGVTSRLHPAPRTLLLLLLVAGLLWGGLLTGAGAVVFGERVTMHIRFGGCFAAPAEHAKTVHHGWPLPLYKQMCMPVLSSSVHYFGIVCFCGTRSCEPPPLPPLHLISSSPHPS